MFCPGCKVFSHGTGGISCDIKDSFCWLFWNWLQIVHLVITRLMIWIIISMQKKTSLALARQFSCQWFLEDWFQRLVVTFYCYWASTNAAVEVFHSENYWKHFFFYLSESLLTTTQGSWGKSYVSQVSLLASTLRWVLLVMHPSTERTYLHDRRPELETE